MNLHSRVPISRALFLAVVGSLIVPPMRAFPQAMDGRLFIRVVDPSSRGIPAVVGLVSMSPEFAADGRADSTGRAVLNRIPTGTFLLTVSHPGFAPAERRVNVRSAIPLVVELVLSVETVRGEVTVRGTPPLFEPHRASQPVRAGRQSLEQALGTTLGRSAVDVVTTMPGWLLEANAVLHPRGSEYDMQYVVDGMPVYDNRSITFAPAFESDEFESVSVLTAGIPAEFGRRLGGVIALDTLRSQALGHRSTVHLQGGSYSTGIGYVAHQFSNRDTEVMVGLQGGATDRYLDPPSLENFTNKASSSGINVRFARDTNGSDRLSVYTRSNRTAFLVPNDLVQQGAGQRQDRRSAESSGQIHYQGAPTPGSLVSLRGMVRDLVNELWSNQLSTPVYVLQDRGFREGAFVGDVTFQGDRHTFKVGGDARWTSLRESFTMAEPAELPVLDLEFQDRRRSAEASLYVQDQFRAGNFAASVGVRFDHYQLLVIDSEFSPRLATSYYFPSARLQLFASYDRVFQPPPTEHLLLSSAAAGLGLEPVEGSIPIPASRANFVEVGVRRAFGDRMRIDAKHYWRKFQNSIDDDVFLNTGLSFPITFDSAKIEGTEIRFEMPRWKGVSSYVSYSNMLGRTSTPVTGGLFIEGGEARELREVAVEFPISQDQRNTVAAMFRFQIHRRVWASAGVRYGSGLPVELEDDADDREVEEFDDDDEQEQEISEAILRQVDFDRGRVRPNLSLDFSIGSRIWSHGTKSAQLQFELRNATDRLNVINFSGLFSGTALAPGRQVTVRLRIGF